MKTKYSALEKAYKAGEEDNVMSPLKINFRDMLVREIVSHHDSKMYSHTTQLVASFTLDNIVKNGPVACSERSKLESIFLAQTLRCNFIDRIFDMCVEFVRLNIK